MAENTIDIGYNKIQVIAFNIDIPEDISIDINDKSNFTFQYNVATRTDKINEVFEVILEVEILLAKSKHILCKLKTVFEYKVNGIKDLIKEENGIELIPDQIPSMLIGNAVSTTRGILLSKTSGTILESVFLPVINADTFSRKKTGILQEKKES